MSTHKGFQVLLFNTNNTIWYKSFVCTQFNRFKYSKWLSSLIWSIDGTITGTTTPGQSGPGINGNKGYSSLPKSAGERPYRQMQFRVIFMTLIWRVLPLCRGAVGILYCPKLQSGVYIQFPQIISDIYIYIYIYKGKGRLYVLSGTFILIFLFFFHLSLGFFVFDGFFQFLSIFLSFYHVFLSSISISAFLPHLPMFI